jgi:hypothetical protein
MAPLRVPPNPFDRWARSESGLHLPSRLVPRAAKRMHHIEQFGQAQCCCDSPFTECTYCGTHDGTASVAVNIVGSVTNGLGTTLVLDGSYELTDKTGGAGIDCTWKDSFDIGGGAYANIAITFACVGFTGSLWVSGSTGFPPLYFLSRWDYENSESWSGSSSDDCVTRFFGDYGSPYPLNFTTYYDTAPWVSTRTSISVE